MMHTLRHRVRSAFTLVELLVVVAIIAVLMALLLPSLARAKELAKESLCLSNQRQIAIMMHTYGNDYNDFIPRGDCKVNWANISWTEFYCGNAFNWPRWSTMFGSTSYVTSPKAWICPNMNPTPGGLVWSTYGMFDTLGMPKNNYEYQVQWQPYSWDPVNRPTCFSMLRLDAIPMQASYVLTFDSGAQNARSGTSDLAAVPPVGGQYSYTDQFGSGGQSQGVWMAHLGRVCCSFADGHAEALDPAGLNAVSNPNSSSLAKPKGSGITSWWDGTGATIYY